MKLPGETTAGQAFATQICCGEEIKCMPKCMKKNNRLFSNNVYIGF